MLSDGPVLFNDCLSFGVPPIGSLGRAVDRSNTGDREETSARAEPFAGHLRDPHEAIVDGRFVYVREWGGRIGVFERSKRRNVRIVEADCAGLRSIMSAGTQNYALCVEPDRDRAITREALIAL